MIRLRKPPVIRCALAIAAALFLAGCPFPIPPHDIAYRQQLPEGVPDFITRGATTREDVLIKLGEPDGAGREGEWMTWGAARSGGGLGFILLAGGGGAGGSVSAETYRRLVVDFDQSGVVTDARYDQQTCPVGSVLLGSSSGEGEPCLEISRSDHVHVPTLIAGGFTAASASIVAGNPISGIDLPSDVVSSFKKELEAKLFEDGGFTRGDGLTLIYRFVEFDPGDRGLCWSKEPRPSRRANGERAAKACLTVDVRFADSHGKEIGRLVSEGTDGSELVDGSVDKAVDMAAAGVARFARTHFSLSGKPGA